jgi:hypothetical protein
MFSGMQTLEIYAGHKMLHAACCLLQAWCLVHAAWRMPYTTNTFLMKLS